MSDHEALGPQRLCVRSAAAADLPALSALAASGSPPPGSGRGVVLPAAANELLLVVADEAGDSPGLPLAMLRLRPAIGLALPRLWYHVGTTVHAAPELGLFHRQRTLLLGHDHTGATELADMAWAEEGVALETQAAALRLLVRAAWLVIARERGAYAARVMAELPGLRDSAGQSPFWQGLGRHFFSGDPAAAAAAHGAEWRSHVAALLPRQLLYASFLPAAAQAAIGQASTKALLLREVLEDAGLRYSHHVNLEDAGPVLEAATDDLPGLATARAVSVSPGDVPAGTSSLTLLAGVGPALRALRAPALPLPGGGLRVGAVTAAALGGAGPVWVLGAAAPA